MKLVHPDAKPLARHLDSVGYDLFSVDEGVIPPGQRVVIPTGLCMEIPCTMYGQIQTRSSTAARGVITMGGVIDFEYRGEVKVIMANISKQPFAYTPKKAIAQMIFLPFCAPQPVEVAELTESQRGSSGFGSSVFLIM